MSEERDTSSLKENNQNHCRSFLGSMFDREPLRTIQADMSCTPASRAPRSPYSMITITSPTDSPIPTERRPSKAYQIFPESPMESESESLSDDPGRERLPSIVVEPSEVSGELRWPPHVGQGADEEDDPFQESQSRTESPAQEDMNGPGGRKRSIGPAHTQLDFSRLTPPPSPTDLETAPPCLRS